MNLHAIAIGTTIAGTLDILSAIALARIEGRSVERMLQGIASGPLGAWPLDRGPVGAAIGLAVHFGIMALMVTAFVALAARAPVLRERPLWCGAIYGVFLYCVMYWIVIPLRWPPESILLSLRSVAVPIAIHILLVGIPIALVVARFPVVAERTSRIPA